MSHLLHDLLIDAANSFPGNIAIQEQSGRSISYKKLDECTWSLARKIDSLNENKFNPFVGILSTVHLESIVSVLGILKARKCYVPLDETSPADRLVSIIDSTKMETLFIDVRRADKFHSIFTSPTLRNLIFIGGKPSKSTLDACKHLQHFELENSYDQFSANPIPHWTSQPGDDLAYTLHTSGSTGVPKGIMLTHRNARTFTDWMQKEFKIQPTDKVASRAPFKFDLSVFDIFNSLKAGATLFCFDWESESNKTEKHQSYVQFLEQSSATVLYTTPSTLISLMDKGELGKANHKLHTIMYAGEPFPVAHLKRLMDQLPKTRFANIYGPTETNIITCFWVEKLRGDEKDIPLGNVVDDTEIIVVNPDTMQQCEANAVGELWCRGGTVTIGYLGRDDLTQKCLVRSPFHPFPTYFWRTGDFGFRDEKGILHYRGRRDHMVKVRGFRVEIGEVESAIAKHPGISEFAVVAAPDEKYGARLICYFTPRPGHKVTEAELQKFAQSNLTDYMVPYAFVLDRDLPRTSSGKIDRVGLAERKLTKAA